MVGVVGKDVSPEQATAAVAKAATNAVRALRESLDPAHALSRIVNLRVMIRTADSVAELSRIADSASRQIADLVPQSIPPSRTTLGVSMLPGGAIAEIELVAEVIPSTARNQPLG